MNVLDKPKFLAIHDAIEAGATKKSKMLLKKLLKHGPFAPEERLKISEFYMRLGNTARAIMILGNEASATELEEMEVKELACQFQLAYLYHCCGAKYKARRTFEVIKRITKKRNKRILSFIPRYYVLMAGCYLDAAYYEEARKYAMEGINLHPSHFLQYQVCHLMLAQAYMHLDRLDMADSTLDELEKKSMPSGIIKLRLYLTRGMVAMERGDLGKVEELIKAGTPLLPDQEEGWAWAWHHELQAKLNYAQGDLKRADQNFLKYAEVSDNIVNSSTYKIHSIKYREQLKSASLTLRDQIGAKASINNFAYGDDKLTNPEGVWHVENKTIAFKNYDECANKDNLKASHLVIDLKAGIIFDPKEKHPVVLTEIQNHCLNAIMASGSIGVSIWTLVDFIYRQDFVSPAQGENRLKRVLQEIKKLGFTFVREKNFYYPVYPEKCSMIIPASSRNLGAHLFLKSVFGEVTTNNVIEVFGVHRATAYRWIEAWNKEGRLDDGLQSAS